MPAGGAVLGQQAPQCATCFDFMRSVEARSEIRGSRDMAAVLRIWMCGATRRSDADPAARPAAYTAAAAGSVYFVLVSDRAVSCRAVSGAPWGSHFLRFEVDFSISEAL